MAYESESLLVNGDPNDSKQSANLIDLGDWMYGSLASVDDVDYFKFTLETAGLLKLSFTGGEPTRIATSWKVDLLDANLDFAKTLVSSAAGNLTASKADSNRSITVTGLTAAAKAGDKFTLVTSASDTQIYTVVQATDLRSGAQTLTIDADWTPTSDTTITFDPARLMVAGGESSLNVSIAQAGTYYLKVSSVAFTDATYGLRLGFDGASETDLNNTKEQAVTENSRLIADLKHLGAVPTTDTDVWLLSTAQAGAFSLNFASGTADTSTRFNVKVETWTKVNGADVLASVTSQGQIVGGALTRSATIDIDANANNKASTYVVTVTSTSIAAGGTGAYTLKATGESLDINDTPLIQVGSYTSAGPDELVDLGSLVNLAVGATKEVALSSFFSASDADSNQTISYKFSLSAPNESSASGAIKLKGADGTFSNYTNGATMTADQLSKAYVVAGTGLGDLQLDAQAFDSSAMPDNSSTSSLVRMKIRVVSSNAGVTIGADTSLGLTEGVASGSAGYEETISFKLKEAPAAGETVTLRLVDTDKQFSLSKTALTFSADSFDTAQTVKVRALNDNVIEGAQQNARLNFTLASNSGSSAYTGLRLDALNFVIADPSNTAATGSLTLTGEVSQGETLTADTTNIADDDGLGVFIYQWERSQDGTNWTNISDASNKSYVLTPADAGSKVRVTLSFIDGKGNSESISSSATDSVISRNVAPISEDSTVSPVAKSGFVYQFKSSDFPFSDLNTGDTLSSITLINVATDSLLRYDGKTITSGVDGFEILRSNLSKLTLTVPSGKNAGDALETLSFRVSDSNGGVSDSHNMSLVLSDWLGVYDALAVSGTELNSFNAYTKSSGLNGRMKSPAVGVDVDLSLASGQTKGAFDIKVDSSLNANGYWVKDDGGFWVNLVTEIQTSNDVTTLKVQVEDASYDADATQGAVTSSGVISQMPLSVVGITPDATEDGLWF